MALTSKSEMPGNATKRAICSISAIRNGTTPLKIVPNGALVAPARIKTFKPIGGVMRPTSITLTIITPYHMGSKPRETITGKRIGRVRRIAA